MPADRTDRTDHAELHGVPIFSAGTYRGRTWSEADLDAMVANFQTLAPTIAVPLKLGHDDDQPLTDGLPALGWATSLARDGKRLVANFRDVPTIVADAIRRQLFRKLSSEIWPSFDRTDAAGNMENPPTGPAIAAVALLGSTLPAVKNLGDLAQYLHSAEPDLAHMSDAEPVVLDDDAKPVRIMLTSEGTQNPPLPDRAAASAAAGADMADKPETKPADLEARLAKMSEELAALSAERQKDRETVSQAQAQVTAAHAEVEKIKLAAAVADRKARRLEAEREVLTYSTDDRLIVLPAQRPFAALLLERLAADDELVTASETTERECFKDASKARGLSARELFLEFLRHGTPRTDIAFQAKAKAGNEATPMTYAEARAAIIQDEKLTDEAAIVDRVMAKYPAVYARTMNVKLQ